jgi:hypothetical protein
MDFRQTVFNFFIIALVTAVPQVQLVQASPSHDVFVEIVSAAGFRFHSPNPIDKGYTVIDCKMVIINNAAKSLTLHSGYRSPFNEIVLNVIGGKRRYFG